MPMVSITGDYLPEEPPDDFQSFAPGTALICVTRNDGDDFDSADTVVLPVVITIGISDRIAAAGPEIYIPFLSGIRRRYQSGDYGLTAAREPGDAAQNRQSVADGYGQIIAVYSDPDGQEIWLAQTLPGEPIPVCLLPAEY